MSAIELLEKAAGHLKDRAETYDKPDGRALDRRNRSSV